MCMCVPECMQGALRCQRGCLLPGMEWQTSVSCHGDAVSRTWVFCKSIKDS